MAMAAVLDDTTPQLRTVVVVQWVVIVALLASSLPVRTRIAGLDYAVTAKLVVAEKENELRKDERSTIPVAVPATSYSS